MAAALTAIETAYAGCRFRSRLEARWAVVFDHLEIEWEYEPEGLVTSAGRYLPDFRIAVPDDGGCPYWFEVKPDRAPQDPRHAALALESRMPVVVARGIPRSYAAQLRARHHLTALTVLEGQDRLEVHRAALVGKAGRRRGPSRGPEGHWDAIHKGRAFLCTTFEFAHIALLDALPGHDHQLPERSGDVDDAYTAARSARFEHGERR